MIVDWIESGEEYDMTEWKQGGTGGHKKNSIVAYLSTKPNPNIKTRLHI